MAPRPINKLLYNNFNKQNFNIPPCKLISITAHNYRMYKDCINLFISIYLK